MVIIGPLIIVVRWLSALGTVISSNINVVVVIVVNARNVVSQFVRRIIRLVKLPSSVVLRLNIADNVLRSIPKCLAFRARLPTIIGNNVLKTFVLMLLSNRMVIS